MFNPFQTFLDIFGLQLSELFKGRINSSNLSTDGGGSVWSFSCVDSGDFIIPTGKEYPGFNKAENSYTVTKDGTRYILYFFR